MSRPRNPDWTVEPFAPDENYAAGSLPWEGTPTKVEYAGASSKGFVPRSGVPAQCINYLFNRHAQNDENARRVLGEIVDFVGQMPALNFVSGTSLSGSEWNFAFFDPTRGAWYVLANSATVKHTRDTGMTWVSTTLGGASGEHCVGGAADGNGNAVICTRSRYIFYRTAVVADSWSIRDALGSALSIFHSAVIHEPVLGRWVLVACTDDTTHVRTSDDRTTWTTRIAPSRFYGGRVAMAVKPSAGRIVLVQGMDGPSLGLNVAWSNDGGVTWDSPVAMPAIDTTGEFVSVAYDEVYDRWLVVNGETTGDTQCEVWASSDGASWTRIKMLTSACIKSVCSIGGLWIGTAATALGSEICYSSDGETWHRASFAGTGSWRHVAAFSCGVLALTNTHAYASLRAGTPMLGVLT